MNNDVLASLEMMLTFGQMMLCLTAQMKKSKPIGLDFLAGAQGFEPRKCQSQSLMPYRLAMPQYLIFILTTYTLYQMDLVLSRVF